MPGKIGSGKDDEGEYIEIEEGSEWIEAKDVDKEKLAEFLLLVMSAVPITGINVVGDSHHGTLMMLVQMEEQSALAIFNPDEAMFVATKLIEGVKKLEEVMGRGGQAG